MKKMIMLMAILAITPVIFVNVAMAGAPNAGDGISDGSGWTEETMPGEAAQIGSLGDGPAPNAGDGIPDGSGF